MFRRSLLLSVIALSGCSFIDDYDRFRAGDGGDASDSGMDGEAAADDASVDATGEAGQDGDGSLEAGVDASTGPGDALCVGEPDGMPCGEASALICLKGFCRTSRCGDGFTDVARGEQCDDANLTRGDGCEPGSCTFSCESAADCDNGLVCDGEEQCDVQNHRCLADPSGAVGQLCPRVSSGDDDTGICDAQGYCVGPNCGNGVVDADEECDPTDPLVDPGCRPDCTQGCQQNESCDDTNACNGSETCDVTRGECRPGTPLTCSDADPCTLDGQCVAASGCVFPVIDADGDGVSSATCAEGSPWPGGDCDDNDPTRYPGATEYCDGKDNDCDLAVDEAPVVMATCYPDADGDGFPIQQGATMACSCPAGRRTARADGLWDCLDDRAAAGADVFPGQAAFFATGYPVPCPEGNGTCVSFDYNCDGRETRQFAGGTGSCGLLGTGLLCAADGYDGAAPSCGETGPYVVCDSGTLACTPRTMQRQQACR